jgi:hypothetical protein
MSSRIAVILQPSYLPWLGYFAQLHRSDVFVFYDDVQFDKESWRNRNRIKTPAGPQWLTVPVLTSGQRWPSNRDVRIDNSLPWRRKHLRSLQQNYARAPFFDAYMPLLAALYSRVWTHLIDLNVAAFDLVAGALGISRRIAFSSALNVGGGKVERLVNICRAVGANAFYEGAAGRDYIDSETFAGGGVTLEYQDYGHPEYAQQHPPFVPYLSTVDLLFNCGPKSLEILAQ